MRRMLVKKLLAMLCAAAISVSSIASSVGAVDTTEAEIEYSLMYLDQALPKNGNMDKYKNLDQYNNLNRQRSEKVKHENGTEEEIKIDEEIVYTQIKDTVQSLIDKVDKRTPSHPNFEGHPSKNLDKPRNWRIAKAIYRWVTKNIRYDWESIKKDKYGNSLRKPQDALFAFATKKCVCVGRADLIKLMMRLAGIPCVATSTLSDSDGRGHVYNVVYLDNPNDNRKGWVLLDVPNSSLGNFYQRTDNQKRIIKERFPAFYRNNLSIRDANRILIDRKDHKINLIVYEFHGDKVKSWHWFAYDTIRYYLDGTEKNAYIDILKNHSRFAPLKNVQIPDDMLKLGLKFKIGKGIESLVLKGDEEILSDLSQAVDLKSIDTTHSNKYYKYDAANKKLVYKKEYIDKLTKKLNDKIQNEYNPIFNEHCSFIKSMRINLNSQQDSTAEARKAAFDFVDGIYNNSVELTDENLNRANNLMDEAIENMKQFKKDTLVTILNKKRKQFEKRVVKHRIFRNSLNGNFIDFTLKYRQNAVNFYNSIYNSITEANVKQAVGLFDVAIKQMDQFKFKYMNNNFMNNNFMNNNNFNNNFINLGIA